MGKHNVASTCNGTLFSQTGKEVLIHSTSGLNLENTVLTVKKPDSRGKILYDSPYMRYSE